MPRCPECGAEIVTQSCLKDAPDKQALEERLAEFFKVLTPKEEDEARKWARANWKIGQKISPYWHPIVVGEIFKMKIEYYGAVACFEKPRRGHFLKAICEAFIRADLENTRLMLPLMEQLAEKHHMEADPRDLGACK